MNRPAVESAVLAWLAAANPSLPPGRVILANQKVQQPAPPYMTALVPTPRIPGGGPLEVQTSFNGAAPAGQEVVTKVVAQLEFRCSVQAFTMATVGSGTASDLILAAIFALSFPAVHDALYAAGLAVVDVGDPFDFTDKLGPAGQGRCAVNVTFRLFESQTAPGTGYIQTVNVTPGFTGP